MTAITVDTRAQPLSNYPHVKCVGNFIFLSGTTARLPDGSIGGMAVAADGSRVPDIAVQTRIVIEQLRASFDAVQARLRDCVEITVFLKDMADFTAFNQVYADYFDRDGPARTTVAVRELPHPDIVVEFRAVAYRPYPSECP
jgi:2-aminomuconate deaminase